MMNLQRIAVVATLLVGWSASAQAQWAATVVEHDWSIDIAGFPFGVQQLVDLSGGARHTDVCFGFEVFSTQLLAWQVVVIGVLPVVLCGSLVAIMMGTMMQRKHKSAT